MALENAPQVYTFEAGSDLSTGQYKFVLITTDDQFDLVAAAGGAATGVLQDKPAAAGRAGLVATGGISKVQLGGTVTVGMKLQSTAAGLAIEAASGDHVLGTCTKGGADGEVGEILLDSQHILA